MRKGEGRREKEEEKREEKSLKELLTIPCSLEAANCKHLA